MNKILSWNGRAKYYIITEKGKRGIVARTKKGEAPPIGCQLRNCTGEEWKEFSDNDENDRKKKELSDTLSGPEQNRKDETGKEEMEAKGWFSNIFGD